MVNIGKEKRWLELRGDDGLYLDAAMVRAQVVALTELLPGVVVTLDVDIIQTPSGRDLMDLIEDVKGTLDLSKVEQ